MNTQHHTGYGLISATLHNDIIAKSLDLELLEVRELQETNGVVVEVLGHHDAPGDGEGREELHQLQEPQRQARHELDVTLSLRAQIRFSRWLAPSALEVGGRAKVHQSGKLDQ